MTARADPSLGHPGGGLRPIPNENAILVQLFRHNLWASAEMVGACAGLDERQLATELRGTYGRLDRTLVHLARSQGWYLQLLAAWQPGPEHELEYEAPFPGVERIQAHLAFTGERLLEIAGRLGVDEEIEFEDDGEVRRLPAWVVLLQAAFHATEHRQQIATTLTHIGLEPPEPDLWAFWDAMGAANTTDTVR